MCGLFGVSDTTSMVVSQQKFVANSIICDSLRGVDSTGMALVDKDNEVLVYKKAVNGFNFLASEVGKAMGKELPFSFTCLGHNRAATIGEITDETAHPFIMNNLVGMHNGTLTNTARLDSSRNYSVDSMELLDAISQYNDDTYTTVLRVIAGSYALVWYRPDSGLLYFARNAARPLSFAYDSDTKELYWASERGMLEWLLSRNKLIGKNMEFSDLTPHQLARFDTWEGEWQAVSKYTPKMVNYNDWYVPNQRNLSTAQDSKRAESKNDNYPAVIDEEKPRLIAHSVQQALDSGIITKGEKEGILFGFKSWKSVSSKAQCTGECFLSSNNSNTPTSVYIKGVDQDIATAATGKICVGTINKVIKYANTNEVHSIILEADDIDITDINEREGKADTTASKKSRPWASNDSATPIITGPYGEVISREKWKEYTKDGCSSCGKKLALSERSNIRWVIDLPVCPDCQSNYRDMIEESNREKKTNASEHLGAEKEYQPLINPSTNKPHWHSGGGEVSSDQVDLLLEGGCYECNRMFTYQDMPDLFWDSYNIICHHCLIDREGEFGGVNSSQKSTKLLKRQETIH